MISQTAEYALRAAVTLAAILNAKAEHVVTTVASSHDQTKQA